MPSSLTHVFLIARREYLERVRAKSFLVMTVLIPLLMGGLVGGTALLSRSAGSTGHLAVITSDAQFATDLRTELDSRSAGGTATVVDTYGPATPGIEDNLRAQLKEKDSKLDGVLVVADPEATGGRPNFEWFARAKADIIGRERVAAAIRSALLRERLTHTGMGSREVDDLMKPIDLSSRGGDSDGAGAAFGSAYAMFFLMYFVILFYGMNVARSIIEEKTNRVFEVMLATVKPGEMMAGKVIGVGAVGLTQVGIWIVLAVAGLKLNLMGAGIHLLPSPVQLLGFVVFFLLGYVLYSSVAASLGAMTNSEQELQQMNIFLMLPLIACTGVIMNVMTNPDGAIAKGFSFFPFTAPLIMYMRIIVGKPGALAVGGSILIMILTILAVLWVAARIYRVGVLMYGKKPNLPEIMRWLRYS